MNRGDGVNGGHYDVIVVGGGVAGSLIAKELGGAEKRVLILEAGTGDLDTWQGHVAAVWRYYGTLNKHENSPYPPNPAAPSPTEDLHAPGRVDYYEQRGPLFYASTYLRALGGSMLHWQGATPRMLPDDFKTSRYGHGGRDWPIEYCEMEQWYQKAEHELGVAGDATSQRAQGAIRRDNTYVYPMDAIPLSYQDCLFDKAFQAAAKQGWKVQMACGQEVVPKLISVPQARNSRPNRDYKPVGTVGVYDYGERCNGNSNCVPICPVQAKYTPLKTQQRFNRETVTTVTRTVVTRVLFEGEADGAYEPRPRVRRGARAIGVEYQTYDDPRSMSAKPGRVYADVVVLAAHAIENATLLLASGARDRNDGGEGPIGRHLMDHPVLVTWALMKESVGAYRGPMSTATIDSFRTGEWRHSHSPFRIEPDNWGWSLPQKSPTTDVQNLIHCGDTVKDKFTRIPVLGRALRERLCDELPRQIQLSFSMEQPADWENRVTISEECRDALGNYRPVIHYNLSNYVKDGFAAALRVSKDLYGVLEAEIRTDFSVSPNAICFEHQGQKFAYWSGSHGGGTHIMGDDPENSVVDEWQESHDHPGLYVVGSGSMPSMGTSNPSLTLAALALRTADHLREKLMTYRRVTVSPTPAPCTPDAAGDSEGAARR